MSSAIATPNMLSCRDRWDNDDKRLINNLSDVQEFLAKESDVILGPVIEKCLLYRPRDIAGFMADSLAGSSTSAPPSTVNTQGHKEFLKTEVDSIVKTMVVAAIKEKCDKKKLKKFYEDHLRKQSS